MIIGIILASGFSNRMGRDKLLIEIEGEKMIERVIKSSVKSLLDEVMIVYRNEEVKKVADKFNIRAIYNANADRGQSEAIKLGIRNAKNSSSYMFILGDQPFINSETIDLLIKEHRKSKSTITIPYYNGKKGMPRILSNIYKDELLGISGDIGGRDIIKRYKKGICVVNMKDGRVGIDIDSPEDIYTHFPY